uniref:Uncharacterized protein n=1 Tax=Rhizophagus irregularis (strain DAOM 181602 / DAOM 197198 / MUCL 43194) TaxID=747089 RepID=U9UKW8_RHIID
MDWRSLNNNRRQAENENALELARWLESRDNILWVSYQDLNHVLVMKMPKNICGMDLIVFWLLALKVMLMLEPHSLILYNLQGKVNPI